MKKWFVCLCLLMLVVLAASCASKTDPPPTPAAADGSEVIGSVNGVDVYRYEYDYYFNTFFDRYYNEYYQSLLEYQGVDLLDEESARELLGNMEDWAWQSCLQASMIRQIAADEYNLSLDDSYYEDILWPGTTLSLNTSRLYAKLYPIIEEEAKAAKGVGETEARESYAENPAAWDCMKVAHIIVTAQQLKDEATEKEEELSDDEAKEAAKKRVEDIIARLQAGEDFKDLAAQYSADGSAQNGGEMDLYFNIDGNGISDQASFDPLFSQGAFQLQNIGDFSLEPVESPYGFHIIKLLDKKIGFDAVKSYVLDSLQAVDQSEVGEYFSNKMQTLQNAAVVECKVEFKYYKEPEETPEEELPEVQQ